MYITHSLDQQFRISEITGQAWTDYKDLVGSLDNVYNLFAAMERSSDLFKHCTGNHLLPTPAFYVTVLADFIRLPYDVTYFTSGTYEVDSWKGIAKMSSYLALDIIGAMWAVNEVAGGFVGRAVTVVKIGGLVSPLQAILGFYITALVIDTWIVWQEGGPHSGKKIFANVTMIVFQTSALVGVATNPVFLSIGLTANVVSFVAGRLASIDKQKAVDAPK